MIEKEQLKKYAVSDTSVSELSVFSIGLRSLLDLRKKTARAMLDPQPDGVVAGLQSTIECINENIRKLLMV